jgi:hypothetical protein
VSQKCSSQRKGSGRRTAGKDQYQPETRNEIEQGSPMFDSIVFHKRRGSEDQNKKEFSREWYLIQVLIVRWEFRILWNMRLDVVVASLDYFIVDHPRGVL